MISNKKIKYQQTPIEEQLISPSTVIKSSSILLMPRGDEAGKQVNYTNIPVQQTPKREIIIVGGNNGMSSDMCTRK